jgi:hypothetical protein
MGLPVFLDECPTYEARHGRIYIRMGEMALAMPIEVFLEGCARGKEAIAKWQVERLGAVVSLAP